MKDELPSPGFNSEQYVRPNQNWICGWACEGRACKLGPGPNGECRVTFECKPALELKPGETKGRWKCTRTKDQGGACEHGPLPDGTCCRPLPRCNPVRSLRAKRGRFTVAVCALTAGVLLLLLGGPERYKFINPGEISSHHTGKAFAELKGAGFGANEGCHVCHSGANQGPGGWMRAAFTASPGPFELRRVAAVTAGDMTLIDRNCLACHPQHNFHQPNVLRDHSCSACHREHQGAGNMQKPDDANCLSCHGDGRVMQDSFLKGKQLAANDPAIFDFRYKRVRHVFEEPRPEYGFTQVMHSFAEDHPEFGIHAMKLSDPNTLRFNHALHLSTAVPPLNGKRLDCANCHQPDVSRAYYSKVDFELSCRACHSLQFDTRNPQMQLPHGNEENVKAFLRSLPTQYAEFGRRVRGITGKSALDKFVSDQMNAWRQRRIKGEDLERQVFLSNDRWAPTASSSASASLGRAPSAGCAWCHQVKETSVEHYEVTRPNIPERWMIRGNFDHSKHLNISCVKCHDVAKSRVTADINLPRKNTCVECHSPRGGVPSNCSTCHSFHTQGRR